MIMELAFLICERMPKIVKLDNGNYSVEILPEFFNEIAQARKERDELAEELSAANQLLKEERHGFHVVSQMGVELNERNKELTAQVEQAKELLAKFLPHERWDEEEQDFVLTGGSFQYNEPGDELGKKVVKLLDELKTPAASLAAHNREIKAGAIEEAAGKIDCPIEPETEWAHGYIAGVSDTKNGLIINAHEIRNGEGDGND